MKGRLWKERKKLQNNIPLYIYTMFFNKCCNLSKFYNMYKMWDDDQVRVISRGIRNETEKDQIIKQLSKAKPCRKMISVKPYANNNIKHKWAKSLKDQTIRVDYEIPIATMYHALSITKQKSWKNWRKLHHEENVTAS